MKYFELIFEKTIINLITHILLLFLIEKVYSFLFFFCSFLFCKDIRLQNTSLRHNTSAIEKRTDVFPFYQKFMGYIKGVNFHGTNFCDWQVKKQWITTRMKFLLTKRHIRTEGERKGKKERERAISKPFLEYCFVKKILSYFCSLCTLKEIEYIHFMFIFSKTIKHYINQKLTKEHLNNTYNSTNKHTIICSNIRIR